MDEVFDVNIWQVYYCTPFDKNLFLCKQCLLLGNIDGMWDSFNFCDLLFTDEATNFKGEN